MRPVRVLSTAVAVLVRQRAPDLFTVGDPRPLHDRRARLLGMQVDARAWRSLRVLTSAPAYFPKRAPGAAGVFAGGFVAPGL